VLDRLWPKELGRGRPARPREKRVFLNGHEPGVDVLDRVRNGVRVAQYAFNTENAYADWVKRFVEFHDGRQPEEMGAPEVERFLTHLASDRKVAAGTQKQALSALKFFYESVLGTELGKVMPICGRHGRRIPIVMSSAEVTALLPLVTGGDGIFRLMCEFMYGSGLRVKECARCRLKDVDLERYQVVVRNAKGDCDRVTVLAKRLVKPLRDQIERVRRLHERDLKRGFGAVWLPLALRRKYPNAERELGWQYLFPSKRLSVDPREKAEGVRRRHHVHVNSLEKAVRQAALDLGLTKQIVPHTFRHSFATRLLEAGYNIRQVQELLGHKDIRTTMIYLHVMESGTTDVVSPLDLLDEG
jgi:integron integrase